MEFKMKTKLWMVPALLAISGAATAADGVYGAFMGSVIQRDPNLNVDTGYGAHAVLGIPLTTNLSLEPNIYYGRNNISNAGGSASSLGGGVDLNYQFAGNRVRPFILGGLGVQHDYLKDFGTTDQNSPLANLGVGFTTPINKAIGFRGEVRAYAIHFDNFPGNNTAFDFRLNLGLTFGGNRAAPVAAKAAAPAAAAPQSKPIAAAPVAAAPVEKPRCAKAPKGQPVDSNGCLDLNKVQLEGVNFVTGSDLLQKRAAKLLDAVADTLKNYPAVKVEIGGHTDSRNKTGQNQSLSERRAKSVQTYLIIKGIAADRLSTKGFASSKPIASNDTDAGRAKNRRVEFKIQ